LRTRLRCDTLAAQAENCNLPDCSGALRTNWHKIAPIRPFGEKNGNRRLIAHGWCAIVA
jgi:hypothetical protein